MSILILWIASLDVVSASNLLEYAPNVPTEIIDTIESDFRYFETIQLEKVPKSSDYYLFFNHENLSASLDFVRSRFRRVEYRNDSPYASIGDHLGLQYWIQLITGRASEGTSSSHPHHHGSHEMLPELGVVRFYSDTFQRSPFFRIMLYVHESRHSDCHGLSEQHEREYLSDPSEIPLSCGYQHSVCPTGFRDIGGLAACETVPWGAYFAAAAFSDAVSKYCVNCSDEVKREAAHWSQDNYRRLRLNLEFLRSGVYGKPLMTDPKSAEIAKKLLLEKSH